MSDDLTSVRSDWTRTSDRNDPFLLITVHQLPKTIDPSPDTSHWFPSWHVPELRYTLLEVQSLLRLDLGSLLFLLSYSCQPCTDELSRFNTSLDWYQRDRGVVSWTLPSHNRISKSRFFYTLPICDLFIWILSADMLLRADYCNISIINHQNT